MDCNIYKLAIIHCEIICEDICTILPEPSFQCQIFTITYNLNGNRNIIGCNYYEFSSGILIENIEK